ncbi:MAG: NAD(P)/FAD-dependent oxidoreductase [Candidatus Lokiarchaeota archaeon]|nr:NAD(P)/FAD-dependent oxidoreductase [Candidatus Lokiarchaeota archaeon]
MKIGIIGSGIAGLTSAAYLVKEGYEVTIFEQYDQIGGVIAPLEKNGFKWDLGQLMISELGLGEPVGDILEELAVLSHLEVVKDDRVYVFPDFEIRKPKEYSGILWRINKLKKLFPDDSKGLDKYWKNYKRFMKLMTIARKKESVSGIKNFVYQLKLIISLMPFLTKMKWNAQRMMDYFFTSKKLQSAFVSILADFFVKPSQFLGLGVFALNPEPFYEKRMPMKLNKNTNHMHLFSILGGMGTLVNGLITEITKKGGQILLNHLITKINISDNKATGLETENGEKFPFDLIIASGGAKETFLKLMDSEILPDDFLQQVNNISLMDSVFMVHIAVDLDPTPYVPDVCTYFYGTYDIEEAIDHCKNGLYHEGADGFVMHIPTFHSPSMAPINHHSITIYTVCPDKLKEGDWEEKKEYYAERLLDFAEERIPGLKEHVKEKLIITPEDFRKRINVDHHAFGGLAPIMGKKGIPHKTPIKNLWFIGDQSESGGSVSAIIPDVYRTMKKIEKSL